MTDTLQIAAAIIILIVGALLATATIRWTWNRFWTWVARTIVTHIDHALGPEPTNRYRDLDDEYRALVLAEHNKGE